jgi:hypothetical protein
VTRLLVVARNDQFPTLNHSLPPRDPPPATRGNLAPSPLGRAAPSFDATASRWIVPPPGMTPGSGAPAEQGHTQAAHKRPPVTPLPAGGRPPRPIVDAISEALTVALGLTVFGLIAGVFWILA